MSETRTPKQIAADKLQKQVFELSMRMIDFGNDYADRKIIEAGQIVSSFRTRVRAHMHPRDREEAVR